MRSTTRTGWVGPLLGVAGFGLYCGVVVLMMRLFLHAWPIDAVGAMPHAQEPRPVLAAEMARSLLDDAAVAAQRGVVTIAVRDGPTLPCATRADRIASDVVMILPEQFGELLRDLGCN